jgi:hypothetical protein
LLPDVELPPLPHPATNATPSSATTRQLNIFRTNDPFFEGRSPTGSPVEGRHLTGCSERPRDLARAARQSVVGKRVSLRGSRPGSSAASPPEVPAKGVLRTNRMTPSCIRRFP